MVKREAITDQQKKQKKSLKGQTKISTLAIRLGWQGDLLLLRQALTHPTFF